MTPPQKKYFRELFGRTHATGNSLWMLIYKRMISADEYDEDAIRGKEIGKQKSYTRLLNSLLEKLIESMARRDGGQVERLAFIRKAIGMGAVKLARKVLVSEMARLREEEEWTRLLTLLELGQDLEQFYRIGLQEELGPDFPSRFAIMEMKRKAYELDTNIVLLGRLMDADPQFQLELAGKMHRDFDEFPTPDRHIKVLWRRLMFRIALLENDIRKAYDQQVALLKLLSPSGDEMSIWLDELNIFLHLCCYRSIADAPLDLLGQIESLEIEQPLIRMQYLRVQALGWANLGRITLDEEHSHKAKELILANERAFDEEELARVYYQLAWNFMAVGNRKEGRAMIREIEALDRPFRQDVVWQYEVLYLVLQLERKDNILGKSEFSRVRKVAEESGLQFPGLVLRQIEIFRFQWAEKLDEETGKLGEELLAVLKSNAHEMMALRYFDFSAWVSAYREGKSIREWVGEGPYRHPTTHLPLAWLMHQVVYPSEVGSFGKQRSAEELESLYASVQERMAMVSGDFEKMEEGMRLLKKWRKDKGDEMG